MVHQPHLSPPSRVDIAPLLRAARAGGPLATALAASGHPGLAAFTPPTHDDQILGQERLSFALGANPE